MTDHRLAPGVWGVLATPFSGPALELDTVSLAGLTRAAATAGADPVARRGMRRADPGCYAGTSSATHSTWAVIGKQSNARRPASR
ncbi:MAG: hypothetical protein JWQ26_2583 [Modestobacter sp.]|nr:hypothetical protein [Modestobacter sp.]